MWDTSHEAVVERLSPTRSFATDTVEQCARYCGLGSRCDMFFWNGTCRFFPHLALKTFNLHEVLTYTAQPDHYVYVLQCAAGMEDNLLTGNDWFTEARGDWVVDEGGATCTAGYTKGIVDELTSPSNLQAMEAGYQYSPSAYCGTVGQQFIHKVRKTVSVVELSASVVRYITEYKPAAYIRTWGRMTPQMVITGVFKLKYGIY